MMGETARDSGRYRTLLELSTAIANQPNVQAVVQSLRRLLSSVVPFDSVSILLLNEDGNSLRVLAFDNDPRIPDIEAGAEVPLGSEFATAIEEQKPVFIRDIQLVLQKIPALARPELRGDLRSGYILPLSTSRKKLGALTFSRIKEGEVSAEDLEMMGSVASHIATAIESALATDSAEFYQRRLVQERDRLRLILEINNHIISHLDLNSLLRAASATLRKYFANDFAGFWLTDQGQRRLRCAVLDFPDGSGSLDAMPAHELSDEAWERFHTRRPDLCSRKEMTHLPPAVLERLDAERIEALAIFPLIGANGPLGLLVLGSRRPSHFSQDDLDLLSQVATQISLSVDNALAYGHLAASRDRLEEERLYLESEIRSEYNFEDIVGKSAAMRNVLAQVSIVAPTASTVLLHGETGTGKELIARAIHNLSPRKDRTFVRLNCAAIPSGLLESELFGHEKGAFTGALMLKRGRFEIADHGSLFLDEIGDISLDLQPKLLRALQEHEFERLGSAKTIHVDVRMIAATHRDLPSMIRNHQFREDLFYRLNVFPIEIPPLRDRREDIPLLVHYFVSRLSRRMQKRIQTISKQAMDAMANANWPGNVRELENFIERAVILTQGSELNVPMDELKRASSRPSTPATTATSKASTFEEAERQAILDALAAASGRISGAGGAAERLGLKRTTLQNKMRKLGISRTAQ
jgi:formate hydrogenlyase transcriptional activator